MGKVIKLKVLEWKNIVMVFGVFIEGTRTTAFPVVVARCEFLLMSFHH